VVKRAGVRKQCLAVVAPNAAPEWQARSEWRRQHRVGGGLSTRGACSKCH
jgi:hypothetical protein